MLRILFTGGGTGGHIYPLIAVARELKIAAVSENLKVKSFYLGACGDYKETLGGEGITVMKVAGGKFRNYRSILNFFDIFRVIYAFFQSLVKLYFLMPDVIFSEGGPGALPVVIAGRFYRIPVIIHDANAIPGKTSLISARYASRIGISFESAAGYFNRTNIALTGNPIRSGLVENMPSKEFAKTSLGWNGAIPVLLVLGGSQGATRINDFIFENLDFLIRDFQIYHQVGRANYDETINQVGFLLDNFTAEEKSRYRPVAYFETDEEMRKAYAASDLIIARAGAGTIFEIAAAHKPSILIPLPEGADQKANAYAFADSGAAIVILQENLTPNILISQVKKILGDKAQAETMIKAAAQFSKPEAGRMLAEEILRLAGRT
ncbi:MAG: UDP-N-acetylglucosamine--N-acetylmuramyl-(pentapeptide) pyrophosphoryl-undecaprenol N-acetylglucosamine transferase [Candidatus Liptonbacteria bacterium]|nr:UDP-N-acetylglucosamine--N-acetylmuramyl-(pentapeptide) pyrophosphoryl-undecaprenol N-acetylglucosamine transferase [Candidatus Liptonbacteria bacterium]